MTNSLHESGILKSEEKTVSACVSSGNDGKVGLLVQNGEKWASILMTPIEAHHVAQVIAAALASAENASPAA